MQVRAVANRSSLDPAGRTDERLRAHYEIERELADRLRLASPDERKALYAEVYDELFARVPDHPQHVSKGDPAAHAERIERQRAVVADVLCDGGTFLEIGAGDCALSFAVADRASNVYAVEVSETIAATDAQPSNFKLLITDGISIPVPPGTFDVAYSNQLMEHLHPDDALGQVRNIFAALSPRGVYVCLTPNRLLGPGDISAFFDDVATGFHLREYTTTDLDRLFRSVGFRRVRVLARVAGRRFYLPAVPFKVLEWLLERLPGQLRKHGMLRRYGIVRKLVCPGGGVVAYKS